MVRYSLRRASIAVIMMAKQDYCAQQANNIVLLSALLWLKISVQYVKGKIQNTAKMREWHVGIF